MITKQMYDDFCKVFDVKVVDKFSRFLDTAEQAIVSQVVENYRFFEVKQPVSTLNDKHAVFDADEKRLIQFERVQGFFSFLDSIRKSSKLFKYVEATPDTKHVNELQKILDKLSDTNTEKPLSRETLRLVSRYHRLCVDLFAKSYKTVHIIQKFKAVGLNLEASYLNSYVLVTPASKSGHCSLKVSGLHESNRLAVEISQFSSGSALWMLVNLKPVTLFVDVNNAKDLQHLANYIKNKGL